MAWDLTYYGKLSLADTDRLTLIDLREKHRQLLDTLEEKKRAHEAAMAKVRR